MKDGFLRVAAATPDIRVADCEFNIKQMMAMIDEAVAVNARLIVFPELCITGYTCGDLFLQDTLLAGAQNALKEMVLYSQKKALIIVAGLPLEVWGKLYNVAAVIYQGTILGIIPKTNIPNYSEFYEARHFQKGPERPVTIELLGQQTYFGTNLLFRCQNLDQFVLAAEICEDLWVPSPPSCAHAMAGATVMANLSASDEVIGKADYRRQLIGAQSARLVCGYVYADAGEGESSTDLVFGAHNLIAENGRILKESQRFVNGLIYTELDLQKLNNERRRMSTYCKVLPDDYVVVNFTLKDEVTELSRFIDPAPFVPTDDAIRHKRCEEILTIQAMGLKKRLSHTHCSQAVVGISGGLDSTLALLVIVRAFDMLELNRRNIVAVTMPGFGTTDRTYDNACELVKLLGAELKIVDIRDAVNQHFKDIGHDAQVHDVTYENSQARERTQVLMDIANRIGGIVVGTGDLSELALGWATYNGDHMSMYGVNGSVPKTLVRHLVRYYADRTTQEALKQILYDVLDTPVSPELIPPKDGKIAQITEDLVGPYELHDFILYYVMRFGFRPGKIYRLAYVAFANKYPKDVILKWLKTFYRRFFSQQFKRSCLPDGPKVGSVALSPRGDFRMPSDACVSLWQAELEQL